MPADDAVLALMWLARCDPSEANAEVAQGLWEEAGASLPPTFAPALMAHLASPHADVRAAAAAALSEGVGQHPGVTAGALQAAMELYSNAADDLAARAGAAAALAALAPALAADQLPAALDFLLSCGLADGAGPIRDAMVAAGVAVVDAHGAASAEAMLPLFESYLDKQASGLAAPRSRRAPVCLPLPRRPPPRGRARRSAPACTHPTPPTQLACALSLPQAAAAGLSEAQYDSVRGGAVVFLGTLARHLDPANPKVRAAGGDRASGAPRMRRVLARARSAPLPCCMHALPTPADPRPFAIRDAAHAAQVRSIVGTLLEVLNTPSESVQRGVSDCLPALMQASLRAVGCNRPRVAPARRLAGGLGTRAARLPLACVRTGVRGWSRAGKRRNPSVRPHPRSLARQALQGDGGFVESLRHTACQP